MASVPIGGILWWSGTAVDVPVNYQICDGTGSTPDLRDRFVPCAGVAYTPGDTGGGLVVTDTLHDHSFSGSTIDDDPAYPDDGNHDHEVTGSSSDIGDAIPLGIERQFVMGAFWAASWDGTPHSHPIDKDISSFDYTYPDPGSFHGHNHVLSGISADGAPATTENLPNYYALYFIMRIT